MVTEAGELGRRIATARRDVGLTQQECASRADMPRTALAKIETGARRVGALELARLAEALEMRVEWLFEDAPPAVVSRRGAAETDVPSPQIERLVERIAREVAFLQEIGRLLELPSSPGLPIPTSFEEAETAAGEIRRQLGYDESEPATDLAGRAADIGLLAFSLELGDGGADGASILLDRGGVALVNGSRELGRRRLTLAHELGHYVYADAYSTDWWVGHATAGQTEARIDRFARALLLPAGGLRAQWRAGDSLRTDSILIASRFRADMATLARRLAELDYATARECDTVRSVRTRRADIVELNLFVPTDLTPPELPDDYSKAVLSAYRGEEISAARAVDLLLHTWDESDLPDLPQLPPEAIWSFVS